MDYPERLRVDNGPEFISRALKEWAQKNSVTLQFSQPGKPAQNAFIDRFNRTYGKDILIMYLFQTLEERPGVYLSMAM